MNLTRTWAIAHNVFRETIRDRILYLVLLYIAILTIGNLMLPELALGNQSKITLDLGLAGVGLLGLVIAVFLGSNLVNKELEKRTIYVLIAKPMTRAEFILGKHLGLSAVLSVLVLLMGLILLGVATLQPNPPYLALVWTLVFTWIELVIIVAAAIMFGTFTSSILATLYTFAVYVAGHFSSALLEFRSLRDAAADSSVVDRIVAAFFIVVPNLERLNLKNLAVYGQIPPVAELGLNALYALGYTTLLLTIAVIVFARRQF